MSDFSFQQPAKERASSKHLYGAFFVLVIFVITGFLLITSIMSRFAETVHPLLDENQEFYAFFNRDLLNTSDFLILEDLLLDSIIGIDTAEIEDLSYLMQESPVNTGVFLSNKQLFYFVEDLDCSSEQFIQASLQEKQLKLVNLTRNEHCYTVFSQNVWQGEQEGMSKKLRKTKLSLASGEKELQASAVFMQKVGESSFIGFSHSSDNHLQIQFGEVNSDFTPSFEKKETEDAVFTYTSSHTIAKETPAFIGAFQGLAGFTQFAGSFSVYKGTAVDFATNKYGPELSWRWEGSLLDANKVKTTILEELAEMYPIAIEQVLPDDSTILELHEDKDAFITITNDEQGNEVMLFTYPDGQIKEVYTENGLAFEKKIPAEFSKAENSCVLPSSLGYGEVSNSFLSTKMWKSVEFSYDQQKMVLCFEKNT